MSSSSLAGLPQLSLELPYSVFPSPAPLLIRAQRLLQIQNLLPQNSIRFLYFQKRVAISNRKNPSLLRAQQHLALRLAPGMLKLSAGKER